MICVIGGIKGGCGKSVTSVNLTVLRSSKGNKVLLVDADEQGTTSDWVDHRINLNIPTNWTTIRLKGGAVRTEVLKLKEDYDDIIIDCGGRDTSSLRAALTVADTFVIPFQPKSFDIWTKDKVEDLIKEARTFNPTLKAYCFINFGDVRGSDNADAANILGKSEELLLLPAVLGYRKAFSNATAEGLGVIELPNQNIKAVEEINSLYSSIFDAQQTV